MVSIVEHAASITPRCPCAWERMPPALWYMLPESQRTSRALLSADQCVVDNEHFFVRGRIPLPVVNSDDSFIWLAWVSLSAKNFERMGELWDIEGRESEPPYFGWLQSDLPYEESTLSLKTAVHTMPLGERPAIEIKSEKHQLAIEQIRGISMARVQEIVERALHG